MIVTPNQISYSIGQEFIQIIKYFQHNIQLRTIKKTIHTYSDLLYRPSKFCRHFCTNPGLRYQGWQGICRQHRCRSLLMPKYVLRAKWNALAPNVILGVILKKSFNLVARVKYKTFFKTFLICCQFSCQAACSHMNCGSAD